MTALLISNGKFFIVSKNDNEKKKEIPSQEGKKLVEKIKNGKK